MNKMHYILISALTIAITGCGLHNDNVENVDINTTNLDELQNVRVRGSSLGIKTSTKRVELSPLRRKVLHDSSMSIGAQAGLAWASERIDERVKNDGRHLDNIYNFNAMVLSHGVIPPVLEMGSNTLNLDDPNTIRISDKTYKIVKQARFATTPPSWREYLILSYSKPELPDKTLLPRDAEESKIWREGVKIGWQKGIEQAYSVFQQSLARLKRDYNGMILYRKLLHNKMISSPFVARTNMGVTGNGSNMRVNDQVLRIVEHPQLKTNSKDWKAIVIKQKG